MSQPHPVTVTRVADDSETYWQLSTPDDTYVLVYGRNTGVMAHELYSKGSEHLPDTMWDAWAVSEAEALGHAIACVAWNA